MEVVPLECLALVWPKPAMAKTLPAATPTITRTMPTMARGQLLTTTDKEIRNEATNKIATAVQAALLWPCPCSAMGSLSLVRRCS